MDERASASTTRTVYLSDYRPPAFLLDTVVLHFDLRDEITTVRARTTFRRNPDPAVGSTGALKLDGEQLELESIALDGRRLEPDEYRVEPESLLVHDVPERFELEVVTRIRPHLNTALEGLYRSSSTFCTQCEAEGFRRITYFPDRPDVLARYTTTIEADTSSCPVLLSNGNLVQTLSLEGGRHLATWEDPFPKPSYLFALVAGDLACVEDRFVTRSARTVRLQVYVEHHNADKCSHALAAMKKAMRWDEEVYGREYDLERYMIVAVDDFNMGAMENKGLNIFNSKYVLASPDTATDADYQAIEGVIAHEYFHNWSGNRVTCRDWFQLSLKEGFTVFRDQEFSADTTSRGVKRIEDVNLLRTHQFREDSGPMAHPVRPQSYQQINNFYTLTVYHKGAEVVRMIRNLLGAELFRRGTDLYFERHDGQAVTTDDFVRAMEDASGRDLGQFRRWYDQAGTPRLSVSGSHDPDRHRYRLEIAQHTPATPGQAEKKPFQVPVAIGLLDRNGEELALRLEDEAEAAGTTRTLDLTAERETFVFEDVEREPVPSVLRGFSAPVRVDMEQGDEELAFLMAHDTDPFNRWDAGQRLALALIRRLMEQPGASVGGVVQDSFVDAFRRTLESNWQDKAFLAKALTLPSETYIGEFVDEVDPQAIHEAREKLRRHLAVRLHETLLASYQANAVEGPYRPEPADVGRRALRNLCLGYLAEAGDDAARLLATTQFHDGGNMTDVLAALRVLANHDWPERAGALEEFYRRWQAQPLVVDKWFGVQATSRLPDTFDVVRSLTGHPAFTLGNPNRVRALLGAFAQGNPVRFHSADGKGYSLLADYVLELDPLNPEVAARLAGSLSLWRRYEPRRREAMRAQLERISARRTLSRHVREVVEKSLRA